MTELEMRCPVNTSRLFGKLMRTESPVVVDGNLMEFACHDCLRALRRRNKPAARVLHRFNLLGAHVETVLVP